MPDMTVAENIAMARLPLKKRLRAARRRRSRDAGRRARAAHPARLSRRSIPTRRSPRCRSPSGASSRSRARSRATRALLIMDEPTAALTEQEAELIFRIVRRLKATGAAVVYISHYLREVFAIADRIVGAARRPQRRRLRHPRPDPPANRRGDARQRGRRSVRFPDPRERPARRCFRVRGLGLDRRLAGVDLDLARGEILGVFGLVGSGVETLGRAIYGALGTRRRGAIRIDGAPYRAALSDRRQGAPASASSRRSARRKASSPN